MELTAELQRLLVLVACGALDEHQRRALVDPERLRFSRPGGHRREALDGAARNVAVDAAENVVQRAVELLVEQAREAVRRKERVLEGDRLVVRQSDPHDLVDRRSAVHAERGRDGLRRDDRGR